MKSIRSGELTGDRPGAGRHVLWSGKAGSALQARGTSEGRGAEALFLLGILSGVTGILGELTR